jgi:hypothetical protein
VFRVWICLASRDFSMASLARNGSTESRKVSSIEAFGFLSRNHDSKRNSNRRSRIRDKRVTKNKQHYKQPGRTLEQRYKGVASTVGLLDI